MGIEFTEIWDYLQSSSENPIRQRINKIIEICKNNMPDPRWDKLYEFEWDTIVEQFESFFTRQIEEIKKAQINGLYFGITTVSLINDENSFALEIGGTNKCNFEDKEFNWIHDLNWRGNAIISNALYQIYKYANEENGLGNDIEWPFCLAVSVFGVSEMMKRVEAYKLIENRINIVVGFHDGDMLLLNGINQES